MSTPNPAPASQTGSCLCGLVTYTLTGTPFSSFLCYCSNCRKTSGATYNANSIYPRDALTVTKGAADLSVYDCNKSGSGDTKRHHFCKNCGCRLFIYSDGRPERVVVMSGGLDEPAAFEPQMECFVRNRRPWVPSVEGLPQFEGSSQAK